MDFLSLVFGTGLWWENEAGGERGVARWLLLSLAGAGQSWAGSWWSQLGWASFWKNHWYWLMITSTTRARQELTLTSMGSDTPSQSHIYNIFIM